MHYVSERWLGGTLTNFRTIRARLNRLEELEKLWETGQIETYSKKMKATLQREMTKIKANLEGIRRMERMPGLMFIIDTRREHIAVKEAKKLGVKTIALIDTDSDPDLIDLPIPGNDDAMKAIEIVVRELADAAIEGKAGRTEGGRTEEAGPGGPRGRRSERSRFRADEGAPAPVGGEQPAAAEGATEAPAPVEQAPEPVAAGQA
jgi:small subunit ribosomal protein S2